MRRELNIGRVRLNLPASQAGQHWNNRLAVALDYADLTPAGMPPGAILVLRHLFDPAPGLLLNQAPWQAGRAWGKTAQPHVTDSWRQAARPFREPVGANAAAVWFRDRSEWLACLTRDIHHRIADQRWWWQSVFQQSRIRYATSPLAVVWSDYPESLPPALALLNDQSPTETFEIIAGLPPADQQRVRSVVTAAYNLTAIQSSATIPPDFQYSIPRRPERHRLSATDAYQSWAFLLGLYYAPAELRRRLAADSLREEPKHTESPPFIKENQIIDANPDTGTSRQQPSDEDSILRDEQPIHPDSDESTQPPRLAVSGDEHVPQAENDPTQADSVTNERRESAQYPPIESVSTSPQPTKESSLRQPSESIPDATRADIEPPDIAELASISHSESSASIFDSAFDAGVPTQLGGLWFLVNVLILMDLLDEGDSLWARLDALGRLLLQPEIPPDAVWQILAALAQQRNLPDAEAMAWAAQHLPAMESWLQQRPGDLTRFAQILHKPAVVFVSAERIDVNFSLEQIDLQCRLAGLDRDPGWLPELPRAIRFHFV